MPFFFRQIFSILIVIFLLSSCATKTAYYNNLNTFVSAGKYTDAVSLVEKSKMDIYGEKNALLYHLDRGFLLHLAQNYTESNQSFERAKKIAQDYFTKSITTEASTLLISDNMRPYYGEDFERALINVFSSINYVLMGKDSDALVEARQVDHFLKTLQTNYGYKNVYQEDAFVRYFMGMLYENQGQVNDAFISYRQALDAYKKYVKDYSVATPSELVNDALRTAKKLGFNEEIDEIKKNWGNISTKEYQPNTGELIILNYNGFSPEKVDDFFEISFGKGWAYVGKVQSSSDEESQVRQAGAIARSIAADEQVRIAFPKYVPIDYRIKSMEAIVNGNKSNSELVEDVGAIAMKSLNDRIARVRIRAIARGVIKFALARKIGQQVEQSSGEMSGWIAKKLLTAASAATELADKRSWRSLPDKILMTHLQIQEGKHSIQLKFRDKNGNEITSQLLENIQIKAAKKTIIVVRTAV